MRYLTDFYFKEPGNKPFPGVVCIGVTDTSSPIAAAQRGWLKGISPEEPRHALVFAIARDLRKGLPLDKWKILVLSATMEFRAMAAEDDFFWEATKLRESIGAQYDTMYYSPARCRGYERGVHEGSYVCLQACSWQQASIQQGPASFPGGSFQSSPGGRDREAPIG